MDDLEQAHLQFDGHPDAWKYDPGYPPTRAYRERWLRFRIQEQQMYGFGCFAVELRGTSELIGACGLEFHLLRESRHNIPDIELYYRLGRAYWGLGYATEAAQRVVQFGFEDLRLCRIVAHAARENRPSIAVLMRLGFQIEPDPTDPDDLLGFLRSPLADSQSG